MALLDLVQRVCDEVGLPRPAAVVASTDQLTRQMFSLANAELEELSKRFDWPQLTREYVFNTTTNAAQYPLPTDYRKLLSDTLYDRTQYYGMRGSVSPGEWQRVKSMNFGTLSRGRVRIYGNPLDLWIVPTPVSTEQVVFEYLTNNFVKGTQTAGLDVTSFGVRYAYVQKPLYAADDDTSLIDEALVRMGLKWRIKHAKGLDFTADLAEYEGTVAREFAAAMAAPAVQVGFRNLGEDAPVTGGFVPENGFG